MVARSRLRTEMDFGTTFSRYMEIEADERPDATRAIAEIQVAREADAYLPQSPTIAVDSDAFG